MRPGDPYVLVRGLFSLHFQGYEVRQVILLVFGLGMMLNTIISKSTQPTGATSFTY